MDSQYRIGSIAVNVAPSADSKRERQLKIRVFWQLDGFQAQGQGDGDRASNITHTLTIRDYSKLPIGKSTAGRIVPGYCFFDDHIYVDTQQEIAIRVTEGALDFWCSLYGVLSLPFLLQELLLQQDKTFVHAAAISVDGTGILLPAFGGVGKTAFVAQAVQDERVQILGDDLVILTRPGQLEPYLRPFALYAYHQPLFPCFFAENQIKCKPRTFSWRVYNKLRYMLCDHLGIPWQPPDNIIRGNGYIAVAPRRVLPERSLAKTAVPLDHVYLLVRDGKVDRITVNALDREQLVAFMLDVTYHEWHSLLRFLYSWLTHRHVSVRTYLQQAEDILRQSLNAVPSMQLVSIPLKMPPSVVGEQLCDLIL